MAIQDSNPRLLFTTARLRLRARSHARVGDHGAAARALQAALDGQPDDLETALRLALHYVRSEQRVLAARTYLRAAEIYARKGQRLRAMKLFDQACKFDPLQVDASRIAIWARALGSEITPRLLSLGQLLVAAKRVEQAAEILRLGAEVAPFDLAVLRPLVGLEISLGEGDLAQQRLSERIEQLTALGRTAPLRAIAKLMVSRFPRNVLGLSTLAKIYLQRGEARRALPLLLAQERREPGNPQTLHLLAKIHAGLGERDRALAALERFVWVRSAAGDRDAATSIEKVLSAAHAWVVDAQWQTDLLELGFGSATASRMDLGGAELTELPMQPPPTPLSCRPMVDTTTEAESILEIDLESILENDPPAKPTFRPRTPRKGMLESNSFPAVHGELRVG